MRVRRDIHSGRPKTVELQVAVLGRAAGKHRRRARPLATFPRVSFRTVGVANVRVRSFVRPSLCVSRVYRALTAKRCVRHRRARAEGVGPRQARVREKEREEVREEEEAPTGAAVGARG